MTGLNHVDLDDGDLIRENRRRKRRAAIDKKWPTNSDGTVTIPYIFSTSQPSGTYTLYQGREEKCLIIKSTSLYRRIHSPLHQTFI